MKKQLRRSNVKTCGGDGNCQWAEQADLYGPGDRLTAGSAPDSRDWLPFGIHDAADPVTILSAEYVSVCSRGYADAEAVSISAGALYLADRDLTVRDNP